MAFSRELSPWSAGKSTKHAAIQPVLFGSLLRQMTFEQKQHAEAHVIDLVDSVIKARAVPIPVVGRKHVGAFRAVVYSFKESDGRSDGFREFITLSPPSSLTESAKLLIFRDRKEA